MSATPKALAGGALDAALALARAPRLAQRLRVQPLPDDVGLVLRLLAGEEEALERARAFAQPLGVRRRDLAAACEVYVQQVVVHPQADPWRALGLAPGAERSRARDHFRLLMLWLHPDRAGSHWREPFARRVIDAWAVVAKDGAAEPRPPAAPQPEPEGRGGPAARVLSWARRPRVARPAEARRRGAGEGLRGLVARLARRLFARFARLSPTRGLRAALSRRGSRGGAP